MPTKIFRKRVNGMKRNYATPTFQFLGYESEENLTVSSGPNVDRNPNLDDGNNWTESNNPF